MIDSRRSLFRFAAGARFGRERPDDSLLRDQGLIAPRRPATTASTPSATGPHDPDSARKKLGFTLREIREYLDLYDADPTRAKQLRLLLKRCAAGFSSSRISASRSTKPWRTARGGIAGERGAEFSRERFAARAPR